MTDRPDRRSRAWALLTARAQQYVRVPGSFGSLKPADVAAMLTGLDDESYAAALLCKTGNWGRLEEVERNLYDATEKLARLEKWSLPGGLDQLQVLVHLALLEATGPSVVCTACVGTGRCEDAGGKERGCELCEGRGRLPKTQRTRADLVGVSDRHWRRVWRDRYNQVDQVLQNWLNDADRHLKAALAGKPREWEKRSA